MVRSGGMDDVKAVKDGGCGRGVAVGVAVKDGGRGRDMEFDVEAHVKFDGDEAGGGGEAEGVGEGESGVGGEKEGQAK